MAHEYQQAGLFNAADVVVPPPNSPSKRRSAPARNAVTRAQGDREYRAARDRRIAALPKDGLVTERDMTRVLSGSVWRLQDLYSAARQAGLSERDGGHDIVQDGQMRYQRRIRNILQQLQRTGLAERLGDGYWLIRDGADQGQASPPNRPTQMGSGQVVLLGRPTHISLMLGDATRVLGELDEQPSMVYFDPPWDMEVDDSQHNPDEWNNARDESFVVPGYKEAPSDRTYEEFLDGLIVPTAEILKDGGYLVMVSGPQQSGLMQYLADRQGLTYVNKVSVDRPFANRSTKRFAHSHWDVSIYTRGSLDNPLRHFAELDDLPRSDSGLSYGRDRWDDVPKEERRKRIKHKNALPMLLPDRIVRALTQERDQIVEPCAGGGSMMLAAAMNNRRYIGIELNPHAVNYAVARVLDIAERTRNGQLAHGNGGFDLAALTRPMTPAEESRRSFVSNKLDFAL